MLKTFYTGPRWWRDAQQPDGTVVWTAPTGHTYTTKPDGALFFPVLAKPTGALRLTSNPPPGPGRGTAMPTRAGTRAQERLARITYERNRNAKHYALNPEPPPPF